MKIKNNFLCTCVERSTRIQFMLTPGVILGMCIYTGPVSAGDYFDPGFLGIIGEENKVDLSAFANPGGVAEGKYPLTVYINQNSAGQHSINFQKNSQHNIVPQITPAFLDELGVNTSQIPELKDLPVDKPIDDLARLIPQSSIRPDMAQLRLDISVPQVAMKPDVRGYVDPSLWNDGIPALMANYNLSLGRNDNHMSGEDSHTNNLFALLRAGANAGAWRLRSTLTHTYSHNGQYEKNNITDRNRNTRFSDTYISRDFHNIRSTILIGDSSTGSDVFDSVPFRGVKLNSNEQMLPAQMRGYAPSITGVANSNARVTIRQNGNIIYETYVPPGPFNLTDVQQGGLSGDFDVTITESDGSIRKFIVPYSSLPVMLRTGYAKYEVTAGRYNGNITTNSREADFVLGSLIYGLPRGFTLYGGVITAENYQAMSAGSGVSMGDIGAISADITASSSRFHDDTRRSGQSYRLRYSKSLMSTGTSVDLTALRYSTKNYRSFSEFNSQDYTLRYGVSPWLMQQRRSSFQTQLTQQLKEYGSLNFRASRDDYWGSDRTLVGLALSYTNSWKGISYGIDYTIDRVRDRDGKWPENRQLSINISVPFSIFGYSPALQNMYATSSITHDSSGRTLTQAGLNGSTLDNNALSYSLSQSVGNQRHSAVSNLSAGWQGSKGSVSGGYSYSHDMRSANLNANGGILVHQGGVTLSRSMGDSVALVSAPGATGATIGGGTAVTDSRGYAVVPYLSPYIKNTVGLDPTTLPEGVDMRQSDVNVYPTKGAVVRASFATRVGYQVLMTLKRADGGEVPFGAIASLLGQSKDNELSSIVGDAGQVYLGGLPEQGRLLVTWGDNTARRCHADFNLQGTHTSPDMPVREITVVCQPEMDE